MRTGAINKSAANYYYMIKSMPHYDYAVAFDFLHLFTLCSWK